MSNLLAPVNWLLEALMIVDVEPEKVGCGDGEPGAPVRLNWGLIKRQDSVCSSKLIEVLADCEKFRKLAEEEGQLLVARDKEDDVKLDNGVKLSIERGVLKEMPPPSVAKIDVHNKTPAEVADIIISQLPNSKRGCVVVLQGMSGTGKGTTTATLLQKLPSSVSWSNGNVFRSLTLLAATHCKNEGIDLKADADKVLSPENVKKWMSMLSFEKVGDKKYEIRIKGLGYDTFVSKIQNTTLKESLVARNIPTVAEQTQGDVIKFAAEALKQMADDGMNVVLEGRAATVQYVPTPHRFELILRDAALLGLRRAAQRIMAAIFEEYAGKSEPTRAEIMQKAKSLCDAWAA